ncbi:uncharacterized protein LOC111626405 isoform X2 [Centruroides sculpturatus]|uniref:uncharacterized protein LOC111626405 isoform X2 n=1 Tax=Centruroides sculpturatus TaxID=218467 RepID=UPI000C6E368F|nr:uncharacterized protein LOC111626405 isoform X2 [Centruroides sculpturatus]
MSQARKRKTFSPTVPERATARFRGETSAGEEDIANLLQDSNFDVAEGVRLLLRLHVSLNGKVDEFIRRLDHLTEWLKNVDEALIDFEEQRWQEIFDVLSRFEIDDSNWIWLGDFNARIGDHNIISTSISDCRGITVNKRNRASKDVNMNVKGWKVLEYCADNDLIILNGRASGDEAGEFTFVSNRGSSVIDLGIVTPSVWNCIKCFRVESCFWSDHCPIVLYLEDCTTDSLGGSGTCYQRIFWDMDQLESLSAGLRCCLEQTPNLSLLELSKVILDLAKVKGLTQRKKTMVGIDDWFDLDCRLMIRARNRAWLEFKKNGLAAQRRVFVLYRSLVKKLCLAKKKEFCKRLKSVKSFYKNNRLFWNLCRARGNCVRVNISLLDWFGYFFSLYGSESPYNVDLVVFNDCVTWSNEILDSYISEEELRTVLSKSSVGGAPGIDGIPTEFWKIDSAFFCLLDNFNKVLRTGVVPDEWKSSLLVPVPKGGSRSVLTNYREGRVAYVVWLTRHWMRFILLLFVVFCQNYVRTHLGFPVSHLISLKKLFLILIYFLRLKAQVVIIYVNFVLGRGLPITVFNPVVVWTAWETIRLFWNVL